VDVLGGECILVFPDAGEVSAGLQMIASELRLC